MSLARPVANQPGAPSRALSGHRIRWPRWRVQALTAACVLGLGLGSTKPAHGADPPQLKPVKLSSSSEPPKAVHGPAKAAAGEHAASAAVAPATAPAASDPLEQLRQRLAGKLSGAKTSEGAGPYDVRVVAKTEPSPSHIHANRAGSAKKTAGHASAPSHAAGSAHAHWSYQGPAGPQTWGGLKPEFSTCANGQRQSPIDIRGGLAVDLEPVKFNYQASPFAVIDNGHTVQANIGSGNSIEVGAKRFELQQFHFHRPSEERIDGRQFEMSLHLVHKDEQGRLAVVAVLFDKGTAQPAVQRVWNSLPLEKGEELAARVPLELNDLLPTDRRYFTYMGSLTTPPCSEGVQWVVMRQPMTMSPEQIELFARMYPMNARPVQQASGRRILQSQ
jgi:carbonic anhydrase